MLEPLFNSKYFEIFKSTYFEEHFQTAASENKLLRKKRFFEHQYQKVVKMYAIIS